MPEARKTPPAATAPAALPVTLVNRRSQPVELHIGMSVRVLLPGAATSIDPAHLAVPQIAWLVAQKVLAVDPPTAPPVPVATPARNPAAPPAPTSTPTAKAATPGKPAKAKAADRAPGASKSPAKKASSRAPSGAGRPAAKPASAKRSSKGEKA